MLNTEGGTDGDEQLWVAQVDRAVTVGNVFLGSTVQCAQCHNHKYDPFTQKQFYQLVAFFDNIKQEIGDGGGPMDYRAVPSAGFFCQVRSRRLGANRSMSRLAN